MPKSHHDSPGVSSPQLLRSLQFGELLGRGSMGSVYAATAVPSSGESAEPPSKFAVRVLSSRFYRDEDFISQFHQDAQSACRLSHPGLVRFLCSGEIDNRHLLVMELVKGHSLERHLKEKGKLPEPQLVIIATAVANALKTAWKKERLLHRAIRPKNIFIDAEGGAIRVGDLGLARVVADEAGHILPHAPVSDPHYTAPELTLGDRQTSCSADIYSLGGTLYNLATTKVPFAEFSGQEAFTQQRENALEYVKELNAALSAGFCSVLEKMLARRPQERYADYDELLADLRCLSQGTKPSASVPAGCSVMSRDEGNVVVVGGPANGVGPRVASAKPAQRASVARAINATPAVVVAKAVPAVGGAAIKPPVNGRIPTTSQAAPMQVSVPTTDSGMKPKVTARIAVPMPDRSTRVSAPPPPPAVAAMQAYSQAQQKPQAKPQAVAPKVYHHHPSWMTNRMVMGAWILTGVLALACIIMIFVYVERKRQQDEWDADPYKYAQPAR